MTNNARTIRVSLVIIVLAVVTMLALLVYDRFFTTQEIETFQGNINLTSDNSDTGLLEFLDRNEGKVVRFDGYIDTSMSIAENQIVEQTCDLNIEAVIDRSVVGTPIPLPFYEDVNNFHCSPYALVLDIGPHTIYEYSSGGTGIVMVRFKGLFEVFTTYHSGPTTHYHLKEIAP
ncbi:MULTISPECIES: hypothetical protein [Gammaproteobacteria]|uniref:hypothetical protein n=1 Tax=Gammaproteobacteria TaxID=1236 RepID=UPI000DCFC293|nr:MULTISPECIES: hypothetical protein [Gammaproteobacteria]RTE86514.1 hypothetical protein DQX04_08130 [Aliidiomarina sp. B3213]TCZ90931.1 hypothetical protein EYQ95_08915 [Lysobacter sp. N42]